MTRTPWFSVQDKPVRVGWYEYRGRYSVCLCPMYWDAKKWRLDVNGVMMELCTQHGDQWRGLVKDWLDNPSD